MLVRPSYVRQSPLYSWGYETAPNVTAILPAEYQLHPSYNQHQGKKLSQYRGRCSFAAVTRANPAAAESGGSPNRNTCRQLRYARQVNEQSGKRIHEDEGGGNRRRRPRLRPRQGKQQRTEKDSAADTRETGQGSDDETRQ